MKNQNKTYQVYMTEEEHTDIKLAAHLANKTINEFFVEAAMAEAKRVIAEKMTNK